MSIVSSEIGTLNPARARGMRTNYCGDVGLADVGQTISVCGWVANRREHGEHLAFVDLRDRSGLLQCVVDGAADLRKEYVIRVTGVVTARSADASRRRHTPQAGPLAELLLMSNPHRATPLEPQNH